MKYLYKIIIFLFFKIFAIFIFDVFFEIFDRSSFSVFIARNNKSYGDNVVFNKL